MTDQQLKAQKNQQEKIEELYSLYQEGNKELGFFGKAGVGKTYSAKKLVELIKSDLDKKNIVVIGAATSHSAKNVLKKTLGDDIDVMTVASMLQLKKTINPLTGEIDFLPEDSYKLVNGKFKKVNPPIMNADLLIIDECSQINKKTKKLIDTYKKSDAIIIYLGDSHQTPPIEENDKNTDIDSVTFDVSNVNLNIPFRYEGELEELANSVALEIDRFNETGECDFKFLLNFVEKESESYKFYRNEKDFKDKAVECFKSSGYVKNCVVVCYRNETAYNDNLYFKREILNTDKPFTINEKIVAKSSYFISNMMIIQNNSLYTIIKKQYVKFVFVSTKEGKLITYYELSEDQSERSINEKHKDALVVFVDAYYLTLHDVNDEPVEIRIPVFQNETNGKFNHFKGLIYSRCQKNKEDWKDYFDVDEFFVPFDSAYVVNSYVVQGDTYNKVFVNFRDILTVKPITRKQKLQSLYTAITRARSHVSILI
jgi:hypothetical protein